MEVLKSTREYFTVNEDKELEFRKGKTITSVPYAVKKDVSLNRVLIFKDLNFLENDFKEFEFENCTIKFEKVNFHDSVLLRVKDSVVKFENNHSHSNSNTIKLISEGNFKKLIIENSNYFYIELKNINTEILELGRLKCEKFKITENSDIKEFHYINLSKKYRFKVNELSLLDSKIDKICFKKLEIEKISVNNCSISNLNINDLNIVEIFFEKYNVNKLIVKKGLIDNVTIRHNNYKLLSPEIVFNSEKLRSLKINSLNDVIFEKIAIHNTEQIFLNGIDVYNFNLQSVISYESEISNCKFKIFELNNFKTREELEFDRVKINDLGTLIINNSKLDNVVLSPSFLHKFKSIRLENSSLQGITLNNFELIEPEIIHSSEMDHQQKIDFVRELNGLMLANNHKHYYTVYRALEQDLRLEKDNSLTGFDKFIVRLNSLSNGHGTRPQKALVWFIVIFLFHILFIRIDLICQEAEFNTYDFFVNYYSYYLKPLTFITELDLKENLNLKEEFYFSGWIKVMDFIYKLLYAYLLYQFIAGFRKFNK